MPSASGKRPFHQRGAPDGNMAARFGAHVMTAATARVFLRRYTQRLGFTWSLGKASHVCRNQRALPAAMTPD
jgi:hypothetical protein